MANFLVVIGAPAEMFAYWQPLETIKGLKVLSEACNAGTPRAPGVLSGTGAVATV